MATSGKLALSIDNQTVDKTGQANSGFSADDIYLVIQGKIKGVYNRLDWATGKFVPMSTADNTVDLNLLGLPSGVKYANYGKKLSEILQLSWVSNNQIPIPVPVEGGRAYISFNQPVYFKVNDGPAPAEPADEVSTDPNFGIVWDKFEFTVSQDANTGALQLWSNTSCVDFVGIPMSFELSRGGQSVGKQGFDTSKIDKSDPVASIAGAFAGTAFDALVAPQRIYAPKVSGTHFGPNFGQKGDYIQAYVDFCWNKYQAGTPNSKKIVLSNFVDIPASEHPDINTDDEGKSAKWTAEGSASGKSLNFALTSLVRKDGKSLSLPSPNKFVITQLPPLSQQTVPDDEKRTTSYDTLRQGGIFTKDKNAHTKEYTQAIDGDIKNQVSTALNRSVMHLEDMTEYPSGSGNMHLWADPSKYYQTNNLSRSQFLPNVYAKKLHELSIDGKCYALAYDDKYDQHVNLGGVIDNTPSVLTLNLYYKKGEAQSAITSWASPTNQGVLAGIDPVSGENGVGLIWFKLNSTTNKTLDPSNIFLMFQESAGLPVTQFPAHKLSFNSTTSRFEVKFVPGSFPSPFQFYFKYRFTANPTVEELFPGDAIGSNAPFQYP